MPQQQQRRLPICVACKNEHQPHELIPLKVNKRQGSDEIRVCNDCHTRIYNFMEILREYHPQQIVFEQRAQ